MGKVYPVKNNFTAGELSELLHGRVDLTKFNNGCKTLQNWIPMAQGGITRRGGIQWVANTYEPESESNVGLKSFIFSTTPSQSNIIEIGYDADSLNSGASAGSYVRVYRADTRALITTITTLSDGSTALPWSSANIPNLEVQQINDILYISEKTGAVALYKLERSGTGNGTWKVKLVSFTNSTYINNRRIQGLIYKMRSLEYTRYVTASDKIPDAFNVNSLVYTTSGGFSRFVAEYDHEQETFGIAFSNVDVASVEEPPLDYIVNARSDYAGQSISAGITGVLGIEFRANLFIPTGTTEPWDTNTRWFFGFNSGFDGSLSVGDNIVATVFGRTVPNTFQTNEFVANNENLDDTTKDGVVLNTNQLTPVVCRMILKNQAINYGYALAWRNGGDLKQTEGTSNKLTLDERTWDSFGVALIHITIKTVGATTGTFDWTIQEQTAVDPEAFGSVITGGTGVAYTEGTQKTLNKALGTATNLPTGAEDWAKITINDGIEVNDEFKFKVGFLSIPIDTFQKRDSDGSPSIPKHMAVFQDRFCLIGFDISPMRIMMSSTGLYEDFNRDSQNGGDAIDITLSGNQVNPLNGGIATPSGLIVLSNDMEYLIRGESGKAVTPSNVEALPKSAFGSKAIPSVYVNKKVYFVERTGIRLRSLYYDFAIDAFTSEDLSILSNHLIEDGVEQIVMQKGALVSEDSSPLNILWVRVNSSAPRLRSVTLEDEHGVVAWAKHTFTCNGTTCDVLSIATVPNSSGGDDLWLLLDCDIDDNDTNEQYIIAYLKNTNYKDVFNTGGSITTTFVAQMDTMPMEVNIGQDQTSLGLKRRLTEVTILELNNTATASVLTVARLDDSSDTQAITTNANAGLNRTVVKLLGWDKNSQLQIKSTQSSPAPATILSLETIMEVNPR